MVKVSFFNAPIQNTAPAKELTLRQVYDYIIGPSAMATTAELRRLIDTTPFKPEQSYKAKNFDFVTFSCTCAKRENAGVNADSGLICIDFDHVGDEEDFQDLKNKLHRDEYFETQLLFRSPSGDGIKWVIPFQPDQGWTRRDYFSAVANYIEQQYRIKPDIACKDICRACFLPHDPEAYINPKLLL